MREKTVEDRVLDIVRLAQSRSADVSRDITCWNYYNEHYDDSQFEYLTKSGNNVYPARLRRVGKQKPLINLLISTQATRKYPFSVNVLSKSYTEKKLKRRIMGFVDDIRQRLVDRMMQVESSMMAMEQSINQIREFVQQEPQDEQQAMMIGQAKAQLPQLEQQYNAIKNEMTIRSLYTKGELEDKERFYRYSSKDLIEEAAQILSGNLRKSLDIKRKSVVNIKSKFVTGKEYYYVNYTDGDTEIEFETLRAHDVFFPQSEGVAFVHHGPWVAVRSMMTYDDVMVKWGHVMTTEQRTRLEKTVGSFRTERTAFIPTSAGGAVPATSTDSKMGVYSGSTESAETVEVWTVWYKKGKFVYGKKTPNPNKEGRWFFHVIEESDISKLKKNEELVKRWIEHRYVGFVIDQDMVVDAGLDSIQPRMTRKPSKVLLPVVGYSYNDLTNRPYSLIWSTKDLQDLYRIVNYMRELVIALSGVRSKIVDMSQIPGWMTPEEHRYHTKLGNMYIETVDENGRKINSSFNQWRDFDDTLTPSIQYYGMILRELDDEIGETMGISRPRRGERINSDQVGTSMQGQQQSELITEIHFFDHDQLEAEAMTIALNLSLKYVHTPEELIAADTDDINVDKQTIRLPKEMFEEEYEFEIQCQADYKEARRIEEVRTIAYQNYAKGMLSYQQLLSMTSSDSIKAMEKKLEYFESKQRELQQIANGQMAEAESNKEMQMIELAKKYEIEAARMNQESKKLSDEVKMQIESMRDQREREKMAMELEDSERNRNTQIMVAGMDKEVEEKYLGEQSRTNQVHEQLEAIKIQLDRMTSAMTANKKAGSKERIKD